ncbi:MAG: hypothetical protein WA705_01020 [Candidatus Ozemobacteraceae bacterium]
MIVGKASNQDLTPDYWVFLAPIPSEGLASSSVAELFRSVGAGTQTHRVGISEMCHESAHPMQRLRKETFSPFLYLEEERFLDLGIQWAFFGIIGICFAVLMSRQAMNFRQTPKTPSENDEESLLD